MSRRSVMTNKICAYGQTIVAAVAEPLYHCSESFIHWLILVTPKGWLFTLHKFKKKWRPRVCHFLNLSI